MNDFQGGKVLDLDSGEPFSDDTTGGRVLDLDTLDYVDENKADLTEKLFDLEADEIRAQEKNKLDDKVNGNLNSFQKFLIGSGRGLSTLGRGVGLVNEESEFIRESINNQEGIATEAGEILGEAAPFLALAPLTGAGLVTRGGRALIPAAESLSAKILGSTALGAIEGGVIAGGRGGSTTETIGGVGIGGLIGGGVEAIFPVIGRLGNALFNKLGIRQVGTLLTPTGIPTVEFQEVLDKSGISFDNITDDAINFVKSQSDASSIDEVARATRFKEQDIPATKGDITQDFNQQAEEQRLLSMTESEASIPLRELKFEQSEALVQRVNDLIDDLGVPAETGETIKSVLKGDKKLLQGQKNKLYKEMADTAPEVLAVPIFTDDIIGALPSPDVLEDLAIVGADVSAVKKALVRFGVLKDEEAVKEYVDSGGTITPLNIGNFDRFRKLMNGINKADQTGAASVAISPIIKVLDDEADIVDSAVRSSGITDESVLAPLKDARKIVRQIKTEFSDDAIVGKLIKKKRDGETPLIESSQVADKMLGKSMSVEQLQKTMKVLQRSGPSGQKAIGNLQSSIVLRALNNALKAPSRKDRGVNIIGGNQFSKELSNFGDDKLSILFGNNNKALGQLQALKQTGLDIMPSASATPKGSAPVILDLAKKAGRLPIIAAVVDLANFVFKAGGDYRSVQRALDSNPEKKKLAMAINQGFPALGVAIGISTPEETEQTETN